MQTGVPMLIVVFSAVLASFGTLGLMQRRRSLLLARKANAMGLRFAVDDPFDLPRRYSGFGLLQLGHSLAAYNVIYGHCQGLPIRDFDLHYELGHGPRRVSQRWQVQLVEMPQSWPELLAWRASDAVPVLPEIPGPATDGWMCKGDASAWTRLRKTLECVLAQAQCVQVCGSVLLVCWPQSRREPDLAQRLEQATLAARQNAGP